MCIGKYASRAISIACSIFKANSGPVLLRYIIKMKKMKW